MATMVQPAEPAPPVERYLRYLVNVNSAVGPSQTSLYFPGGASLILEPSHRLKERDKVRRIQLSDRGRL